jgi:Lrp/AsnC family leucine-responsive transcriptional regulator
MERENPNVLNELKSSLSAREEVMQCYWVTGKSDFVLIMTFSDMSAFERFCEEHFINNKNVKRFYTNVVVSRVKFGLSVPID